MILNATLSKKKIGYLIMLQLSQTQATEFDAFEKTVANEIKSTKFLAPIRTTRSKDEAGK